MATPANKIPAAQQQAPTPSQGPEGSDLRTVAKQIEGLLDDDGQFNPNPDQLSRGHPDYNPDADDRNKPSDRDERGRFKKASTEDDDAGTAGKSKTGDDDADEDPDDAATGDDQDADTGADDAGDTDDDLAASADDDAQTDDAETETIQTLEQLASALDIPIEELKAQITHTFRAADDDVTVTLAELEKGYQKDADYRRNTGKLAEDRRAAEADYSTRMQQFDQQNYFLSQQFQLAENVVAAELNDPRFAQLRDSDPSEWLARREEMGQRLGSLRQARQQAAANYPHFLNSQRAELKAREQRALLERIPDFSNEHRDKAKSIMASTGYTDSEISQIFDHRLVVGALELAALRAEVAELRELKKKATDTVKRVKKDVPKFQKPGKQRAQAAGVKAKRDNLARLRERARKSGNVKDAAKVIEHML